MINDLSLILGIQDKCKIYRIVRSVLHTLRDSITTDESIELMTKVPLFVKVIYAEDWKKRNLEDLSTPKTIHDFIDTIKDKHEKEYLGYDFTNNTEIEDYCRMVLGYLCNNSKGFNGHDCIIPKRINRLFNENTFLAKNNIEFVFLNGISLN